MVGGGTAYGGLLLRRVSKRSTIPYGSFLVVGKVVKLIIRVPHKAGKAQRVFTSRLEVGRQWSLVMARRRVLREDRGLRDANGSS